MTPILLVPVDDESAAELAEAEGVKEGAVVDEKVVVIEGIELELMIEEDNMVDEGKIELEVGIILLDIILEEVGVGEADGLGEELTGT
jgi:hypothetical protein